MDSLIFCLLLATFLSLGRRGGAWTKALFFSSLAATLGLFASHVTDRLPLSF